MSTNPVKADAIDGIISYLETIDWSDPWLWGLIAFHFTVGFLTCVTILLKRHTFQVALFCMYLLAVYSTEYINEWAANNFKLFSKEQYFDDKGLFISLMLSAPLLVNSLLFVFVWMYDAYTMLIRVQRAKLKYKLSKDKQTTEKTESEGRIKDWLDKKDD